MLEVEKGSKLFGNHLSNVLRQVKLQRVVVSEDMSVSMPHSSEVFSDMCGVEPEVVREMERGFAFRYLHEQILAVKTAMVPYLSDTGLVEVSLFERSIFRQKLLSDQRDVEREIELSAILIAEEPEQVQVPSPVAIEKLERPGRLPRGWASRI